MSWLTRPRAMLAVLGFLALLLGVDAVRSRRLDPFAAPAPLAVWSGETAGGGFCGAPAR